MGATDATAATDALGVRARSPRNFCRTPSSHSERFSSDSESAVRPPTLRTPGRNTSDSEKTTLGLREAFSSDSEFAVRPPTLRTPGRNTSDSEKTTLGLRENNPRTPRKQPSDSEKTTLGLTDSEKTILETYLISSPVIHHKRNTNTVLEYYSKQYVVALIFMIGLFILFGDISFQSLLDMPQIPSP